jgi:two-component system chemotaxis response regulator CheB
MDGHDIIVIGASAGGVEALKGVVGRLPPDLPATVFIVLHLSPHKPSWLPQILARAGVLSASYPDNSEAIKRRHIYVAPPDHHLMILDGHVTAKRGPKENRFRPSANTLFRTAAETYGSRVVGVVLTGALDDGTAGLQMIKEKGGVAIVQDPSDACFPSMPSSALRYVSVDHCLPVAKIAPMLETLARDPVSTQAPALSTEVIAAVKTETKPEFTLTCPECRSSLRENYLGTLLQYSCRVGHRFTPDSLLADQSETIERTLWLSVAAIEERVQLLQRLEGQALENDRMSEAARLGEKALKTNQCGSQIRELVLSNDDWYSVADL